MAMGRCRPISFLAMVACLMAASSSARAQSVTATVTVGAGPEAIAVNPATNRIYVANATDNTVTVIDGATNATTTVPTGTAPSAIVVNAVTNQIYVANTASDNVTVIDGATNATTTVALEGAPEGLAINPVTNRIYVVQNIAFATGTGSNDVTVIDGATNAATPLDAGFEIFAGATSEEIAVNPATNEVYVGNGLGGSVTDIDGRRMRPRPARRCSSSGPMDPPWPRSASRARWRSRASACTTARGTS
jgi:YVTN family beta-propeller protein